ncbi:unnamed protein product, partial [Gulo gulo]
MPQELTGSAPTNFSAALTLQPPLLCVGSHSGLCHFCCVHSLSPALPTAVEMDHSWSNSPHNDASSTLETAVRPASSLRFS